MREIHNGRSRLAVLLLVVVLSLTLMAPSVVLAQDPALTQIARTNDGNLSVRLPESWVYFDDSGDQALALFSTLLFFGENQREVDARLSINRSATGRVEGLGGVVGIVDSTLYQQLVGAAPDARSVLQLSIDGNVSLGATATPIESFETISYGTGYYSVIDTSNLVNEIFLGVTFETELGVVLMGVSGSPTTYDPNLDLLTAIVDSVRVPAESALGTGSSGTGLGSDDPPPPPGDLVADTVVRGGNNEVSIWLPSDWVTNDMLNTPDRTFVFAESQAALDTRTQDLMGDDDVPVVGMGGAFLLLNLDDILGADTPIPAGFATDVLRELESEFTAEGGRTIGEYGEINNQIGEGTYVLFEDSTGEIGAAAVRIFNQPRQLAFIIVSSDDGAEFQANAEFAGNVIGSLSIPAQADDLTNATAPDASGEEIGDAPALPGLGGQDSPSGPGLPGMGGAPPVNLPQTITNSANTFAFGVPQGWAVSLGAAPQGYSELLYFGVNLDVVAAFRDGTAQNGPAGAYLMQPRTNLDPNGTMNIEQLYDQVFGSATFSTIAAQTGQVNGVPARWAEGTLGNMHGYWVVIAYPDQVVVFILTTPESQWSTDQPILQAIFNSARYNPAGVN